MNSNNERILMQLYDDYLQLDHHIFHVYTLIMQISGDMRKHINWFIVKMYNHGNNKDNSLI